MNTFWDEKYANSTYVYGKEPNDFLKETLSKLKPGKLLLPAEGEGRNAVFAAKLGWEVTAFDTSIEGQKKALSFANEEKVTINYLLQGYQDMNFEPESFDAIALTYAHMPEVLRHPTHKKLCEYLKPKGHIIFEAFDKEQINFNSGGPKDLNLLVSTEILEKDFTDLKPLTLTKKTINLNEGPLHQGEAKVVRFLGQKS